MSITIRLLQVIWIFFRHILGRDFGISTNKTMTFCFTTKIQKEDQLQHFLCNDDLERLKNNKTQLISFKDFDI